MTTIQEATTGKTPLGASLDDGVATLSLNQTVTFNLYLRVVLPADGFVFWVRASLLSKNSAAYNNALYNSVRYAQAGQASPQDTSFQFPGSLHFSTLTQQNEADSASTKTIVFTARQPVEDLDAAGPNMMWIASYQGIKFAFRERAMFYKQSALHHYRGVALYSMLETQVIDAQADLPTGNVVSNSLPLWLMMNQYAPVYPSNLVPQNLPPPYIAVHIPPGSTDAFSMQPWIDARTGSSWQLSRDTVKFTLYGLQNDAAIDFQNYILNGSLDDDSGYGILGTRLGAVQDEKQTQPEMQILAQRKTLQYDVSYYQARIQAMALQYIEHAMIALTISPNVPSTPGGQTVDIYAP